MNLNRMHHYKYIPIGLFIFFAQFSWSQISGTVADESGNNLPYATISVTSTNIGTTTNGDGVYSLGLSPGQYELAFQYLGYETVIKKVSVVDLPIVLNVTLKEQSYQLSEITISADAEDPAYGVMRKAIAHREKNKASVQKYEGDLYIKGLIRTTDAPESFMGQDLGDMEGILDTNRQGVLYLSESKSTIYFQAPDKWKEVMEYSKTAGNDNGITFNQFSTANFNFYYENINFDRTMVSPLSDAAFRHYRFKLEGFYLDENKKQINKIKVIPKNDVKPLFYGTLFIVEDEWVISSLDLAFTGKSIKNNFFNEIRIRQLMNYDQQSAVWYTQNQIIDFDSKIFGFQFSGTFSYFFNNIILNQELSDHIFGAEIFTVEEAALDKPASFWDSIRPIPLTLEERNDFVKKDSIKVLRESKPYLDSIDARGNRFTLGSLFFGYSHNNSFDQRYFRIASPIGKSRFNAVEGLSLGTELTLIKNDQDINKRFVGRLDLRYGLSDKQFKYNTRLSYRTSRKNVTWFSLNAGRQYVQFDEREAISNGINTWSSLLYKNNYARLFDKRYIRLGGQTEIANGLYSWIYGIKENRRFLENNTNYSFFRKDQEYLQNTPITLEDGEINTVHDATIIGLNFRWRPGQKYFTYPKFKARILSDWPTFSVEYRKAIATGSSIAEYDRLLLRLRDNYLNVNNLGYLTLNVEFGSFLQNGRKGFMDYFHFSTFQTTTTYFSRYVNSFKNMPFYQFSTDSDFFSLIYEHHLEGYLFDQIPFLKDSGLSLVLGFGGLIKTEKDYYEWSVGVEGFKIAAIPFLRLDYVQSYTGEGFLDRSIKIGFTQFFNQAVN